MARRLRFHSPNATYHVMLSGNNGGDIFFVDSDRARMCLLLQQSSERFGYSIEAFCFMSNHIHLAIRVSETNISKFMHYLAFRYARYINYRYKRIGHLFQGRFKSVLIDGETYLKELIRYIHLNPVRAKITSDPLNYPWSSHQAYLGQQEFVWLSNDRVLSKFHPDKEYAKANFNKYVLSGIGVETDYDFKSGLIEGIVGDKGFVDEALSIKAQRKQKNISLDTLISFVCSLFDLTIEEFNFSKRNKQQSQAHALTAFLIREIDMLSLEQLGNYLKKDPSGLSKLANRLEIKLPCNLIMAQNIQKAREWIHKMSGCQA